MKLYFAKDFSSLADHIAMLEAGVEFDIVEVDLETKKLADGSDYAAVNPRSQVPALVFDDGTLVTENVAILAWVAEQAPELMPRGELGRYRLLEMLALIATEIHKRFPITMSLPEADREAIMKDIARWFAYCGERIDGAFLLGDRFTPADSYLYVMARGAIPMGMKLGKTYDAYIARIDARPAVQQALKREADSHRDFERAARELRSR